MFIDPTTIIITFIIMHWIVNTEVPVVTNYKAD